MVFGVVNFAGSYMDFYLWGMIEVQLPDMIWKFSSYIEIALGYIIMKMGSGEQTE